MTLKRDHLGRIVQTPFCSHPAERWPGCSFCEEASAVEGRTEYEAWQAEAAEAAFGPSAVEGGGG